MKGKSYTLPAGMIFKKFYCCKCGAQLLKEKNHRVVSPGDVDYYYYQKRNTYPKISHDVYDHHFMCPSCNRRYSFEHQCIIEVIQKEKSKTILSEKEYRDNFLNAKKTEYKKRFISNLLVLYIFIILSCAIAYVFSKFDKVVIILTGILLLVVTFENIRSYELPKDKTKNFKSRQNINYSQEEEFLVNFLYSFSYNNKDDIYESDYCYCFKCNKKIESKEITSYLDNIHALCPICNNRTIIADSCEEVDEGTIELMNKYWF